VDIADERVRHWPPAASAVPTSARFSLGQAGLAQAGASDPAQTTSCAWVTNTPQ
jgi:hypothetical protein